MTYNKKLMISFNWHNNDRRIKGVLSKNGHTVGDAKSLTLESQFSNRRKDLPWARARPLTPLMKWRLKRKSEWTVLSISFCTFSSPFPRAFY